MHYWVVRKREIWRRLEACCPKTMAWMPEKYQIYVNIPSLSSKSIFQSQVTPQPHIDDLASAKTCSMLTRLSIALAILNKQVGIKQGIRAANKANNSGQVIDLVMLNNNCRMWSNGRTLWWSTKHCWETFPWLSIMRPNWKQVCFRCRLLTSLICLCCISRMSLLNHTKSTAISFGSL